MKPAKSCDAPMTRRTILIIGLVLAGAIGAVAAGSDSRTDTLAQSFGAKCSFDQTCPSGLYQISCQPELDGPVHYVNPETEKKVYSCGEAGCCTPEGTCVPPVQATQICEKGSPQ